MVILKIERQLRQQQNYKFDSKTLHIYFLSERFTFQRHKIFYSLFCTVCLLISSLIAITEIISHFFCSSGSSCKIGAIIVYLSYVFYGSLDTENVNPFLTVFLIALHTSLHSNNVFFLAPIFVANFTHKHLLYYIAVFPKLKYKLY